MLLVVQAELQATRDSPRVAPGRLLTTVNIARTFILLVVGICVFGKNKRGALKLMT